MGSSATDRLYRQAVLNGRRVTAYTTACPPISGYIRGLDDFHVMTVAWDSVREIVLTYVFNKSQTTFRISAENDYADEAPEIREQFEKHIGAFRARLERETQSSPHAPEE